MHVSVGKANISLSVVKKKMAPWLFRHIVKTREVWQLLAFDLLAEAQRETDCQRQTEPWGGCNEYAAPYGVDDLINNHKLSQWPCLLGAALCARANGSVFSGRGGRSPQETLPAFRSHAGVQKTLCVSVRFPSNKQHRARGWALALRDTSR